MIIYAAHGDLMVNNGLTVRVRKIVKELSKYSTIGLISAHKKPSLIWMNWWWEIIGHQGAILSALTCQAVEKTATSHTDCGGRQQTFICKTHSAPEESAYVLCHTCCRGCKVCQ